MNRLLGCILVLFFLAAGELAAQTVSADPVSKLRNQRNYAQAYNQAIEAIKAGDYSQAAVFLDKALEYSANAPEALLQRAKIFLAYQDYDASLQDVETILKNKPETGEAWYLKGILWMMRDSVPQALQCLNEAIRRNYTTEEAFFYRGVLKNLQGEYNGAIYDFTMAIDKNPNHAMAFHERA
ncbi:MAG TPA: tetratricopeptide repeat protein, partial [Bacteroidales bacterium]|nr:tetratricopeptide repeat protein [Bacteroidales bacterium]